MVGKQERWDEWEQQTMGSVEVRSLSENEMYVRKRSGESYWIFETKALQFMKRFEITLQGGCDGNCTPSEGESDGSLFMMRSVGLIYEHNRPKKNKVDNRVVDVSTQLRALRGRSSWNKFGDKI